MQKPHLPVFPQIFLDLSRIRALAKQVEAGDVSAMLITGRLVENLDPTFALELYTKAADSVTYRGSSIVTDSGILVQNMQPGCMRTEVPRSLKTRKRPFTTIQEQH